MTDTSLLAGSLSNDLFRVVNLQQRGSMLAAQRFLQEAKRWSGPLAKKADKKYIRTIAEHINLADPEETMSMAEIEKYLMFGVLLQNYTLHNA